MLQTVCVQARFCEGFSHIQILPDGQQKIVQDRDMHETFDLNGNVRFAFSAASGAKLNVPLVSGSQKIKVYAFEALGIK